MGFMGLVDTKEVEAFATTLAEDLGRRFPPASEKRTDTGANMSSSRAARPPEFTHPVDEIQRAMPSMKMNEHLMPRDARPLTRRCQSTEIEQIQPACRRHRYDFQKT